jgi:hypothetical protein
MWTFNQSCSAVARIVNNFLEPVAIEGQNKGCPCNQVDLSLSLFTWWATNFVTLEVGLMMRLPERSLFWGALSVALVIGLAASAQAQSVTFQGSTTGSDYSDAGLDLGNLGFWFANFDATTPQDGQAINANEASSLPSWISVNPTPDTTFAASVTTSGGHTPWAFLTLPDGTNGLSGAAVDANTANNSNNSIRMLQLGPGAPRKFLLHVVTDNTAGEHDPASRLRARYEKTGTFDVSAVNTPPGLGTNMNGSPDVYTWLYDIGGANLPAGAFIKLQLNSGNAGEQASIAGFMIDNVPEPSSALLLILGAIGCGSARLRRRGQ